VFPDVVLREEVLEGTTPEQKRVFRFPKSRKLDKIHDDPSVSSSLTDMVERYLELEEKEGDDRPRKSATTGTTSDKAPEPSALTADSEVEEYVYDIYYRKKDSGHEWDLESANVGIM
jgi:hypothetical protein